MGAAPKSEVFPSHDAPERRAVSIVSPLRIAAALLALAFLIAIAVLAHQENGGPPHMDMELPGNEPATLYTPYNFDFPVTPAPAADRPAGVVLVHGYSADRQGTSELARRIAQNGYVVLAIDGHGHGANRNPFTDFGAPGKDALSGDIRNAVDIMRALPLVDPARIVVIGHSMGAGAALDYAQADKDLAGSVMISGGRGLWGPEHPRNAMLIFAEHDAKWTRKSAATVAAKLAGVQQVELGKLYGDLAKGSAVEAVEVPHVGHAGILHSTVAAHDIIVWLDSITGTKRTGALSLGDPRRATTAVALLLFLVLLVPLGRICGSLAPGWKRVDGGGWLGLGIVAGSLIVAMPLVEAASPADFLSTQGGDQLFSWMGVAGVILIAILAARNSIDWHQIVAGHGPTLLAGAIALALIYAATIPMTVAIHRLSFTPERLIAACFSTMLALPFFLGFEMLVRRGGAGISTTLGALGRLTMIVLLFGSIDAGIMPIDFGPGFVGIFVVIFTMFEVFAASVYSVSGNIVLIATVESAWLAWIISAWMPIKILI
ncbi:dienelactone hydrolase family protein [Candidatus Binatus sp.]|uniref:dienelactone hydrolase family protein n=1 Tax=Candidatus Binatus sp. TaxID=2811406 RepID=UPI003BAEE7FF